MPKIAFVGAGSVVFTRNLLGDILAFPELAESEISLHDIDSERLETAELLAHRVAETLGATPNVTASLDRRAALEGADYVINSVQVGGHAATVVRDQEIPPATACARRSPTRSASAASSARRALRRSCSASAMTWPRSAPAPGCSTTRTLWR
jgi:alpha-galactosidase/6-phospho-beta-glucosidase family protein